MNSLGDLTLLPFAALGLTLLIPLVVHGEPDDPTLEETLRTTEIAFATTMADRDHAAFASFIADEAVFFSGDDPLRGKDVVVQAWKGFFDDPEPPFSWEPEVVVVLASGELGLTSGPVRNSAGEVIATFNSIWRRQPGDSWKVVFDRGCAR